MGNCTDTTDTAAPKPQGQTNTTSQQIQSRNTTTVTPVNNTKPTNNTPANTTTNTTNTTAWKGSQKHQQELAKHNQYRAKHHAQPLVLSQWLCKGAQKWADYLAKNNKFQHSSAQIDGKGVGQNIYWSSAEPKGGLATKAWYDQVKDYKYGSGQSTFSKTGHFSQVVWKASKQVGFGYAGGVVVGNYYPAGNLMGFWEKNVQKP